MKMIAPFQVEKRRPRLRPGIVFGVPVEHQTVIGVICTQGDVFHCVFFDQLIMSHDEIDAAVFVSDPIAGFWTTDALIYHGRWPLFGTIDLDVREIKLNKINTLSEYSRIMDRTPVEHTTSYSPAAVAKLLIAYFLRGQAMPQGVMIETLSQRHPLPERAPGLRR